ncbi:hypothetical protein M378DRAFT_169073 [Amanita muscaria Koide BX008]|uniref:Nucleoporin Nup159/Nup146 N-terminal domain-containing protein n=1 Tax=Amanita muscaria (strain Koide BX008) TaxID=946122 RepID=A0A0C2S9V7_AMAMK|nr:hypothetical protein M378DRAFT_169073 [Amanita muscaria Koide BX008]
MASLTPLSRPTRDIVKIDPNPRDSMSDGFNYPSFHLLNKQARVFLSEPQPVNPVYTYRLLAIANIKGWFAAVRKDSNGMSIIFSTLHELRSSLKSAKENDVNLLVPQRTVRLPAEDVNIITFGMHDARLLVGFIGGQLLVYDTVHLFSAGTNEVAPLNMSKTSSAPFLQILPNPGTEADLARLIAVARGDGVVQVLDMNKLEVQCGWIGEGDNAPVAMSWAPKGKHLAIGLRDGHIITYALSNNAVPHKQIPPTADGYLVSVDWISSPLVFKTTYCSKIPESSDATLHIVHADAKSSTGFYYNLMHPFPAADRNKMHALTLSIPKWDEDAGTQHENSSGLVIVGDMSSVDLEVLAHKGAQWFQQSQENPLQLPLDKNMNDTILASLEADLTDSEARVPIMYAYLNDGTLQGWQLDHPKPYIGMTSSGLVSGSDGVIIAQETVALAPALSPPATFGQTVGSSTFGQPPTSPFTPQQPPSSHFGQQPTFGQPSFGSGQNSSTFVQNTTSPFANVPKTASTFGSPPPSTSAFGGFGTSGGISQTQTSFSPDSNSQSFATPITREASMSDETSLGGLSLGGDQTDSRPKSGGVFGSFATPTNSTSTASGFDGIVKPATGFGAFSNYQSQQSTTPTSNDANKSTFSVAGPASATTSPGQPVFSQSGFGKPSFGQSSFGQSSFGQPSFGKPGFSTATTTGSGGFSSFASNNPSAFATPSKPATTTGGFGAFASGAPTAFGAATTTPVSEPPKTSPFATPSGAFGAGFGGVQTSFKPSAVDDSPPSSPEPMSVVRSALPVDDDMSPPGSPVKRDATPMSTTPAHAPPSNAFSNLSAPARPASGFGAFGGVSPDSPFFKKTETTPATPSALFGKEPASTTPAVPPPVTAAAKFGASSMPGVKSAFAPATSSTTPAKSPPSGGFSAFSGSAVGFASFAGSGKSFAELLKTTDREGTQKDKEKESAVLETPKKEEHPVVSETPKTPVFTPPPKAVTTTPTSEPPPRMTEKEAEPEKETPTEKKPISSEESFVEISKEEGEITDEEGGGKGTKEEENDAYSSDSLGPSDSEGSIDGTEDEEEELEEVPLDETTGTTQHARSVEPASIPLPISRSPSAPPEVPSIQITPSPEATTKKVSPVRELSPTPPETTTKTPVSFFSKPAPSTTPTSQPFSIGLGRPSTRPARSSPLAGAPVTVNDQDEGSKEKRDSELPKTEATPSPKAPFTELPVKTEAAEEVKATSPRPRTPPLLSTTPTIKPSVVAPGTIEKTASAPAALPFSFQKPESVKPSSAPSSIFGGTGFFSGTTAKGGVLGQASSSESTTPATGVFKAPFTAKADIGMTSSNGFFGTPPARPVSTPMTFSSPMPASSETTRPASVPPSNFFGKSPPKTPPTFAPSSFGIKGASGDAPSIFSKTVVTAPAAPPAPVETQLEEGMQKECAQLYNTMNQELQELRQLAQEASKKRQELEKSRGGSRRKADLGDASKWGLVDVAQFGQSMKQFGPELLELLELRVELKQKIRQIETKMLKAGTRKEEIARFTKAQNDKEFAKMLKTRTLGPEHLETQTQLRRSMRIIRDRVQKLEEHLQASKKKLAEANSGKPSFKAPTLDTVNRTYRNINLAISLQTEEIADLSERISKLRVSTPRKALLPSQRDPRLPDNQLRRPFNVTPHIAVTTAAALNAERSSQKLKKALLAARKEPLLNDKAAHTPAARITFKTPTKMGAFSIGPSPKSPGPLFPVEAPQTPLPEWSFPEDDFNPSPSPPMRRGAATRTKMHTSNAPLRKSGGPSQPPPATFDWGPLPAFNPQPLSTPVKSVPPTNPPGFVPFAQFKR